MTRDDFVASLARLTMLDLVKHYKTESPSAVLLEMYPDVEQKTRTQLVAVQLTESGDRVLAFSIIGPCPKDPATLRALLTENLDGNYSRLALLEDDLAQVYTYPLEELEPVEMVKAIDEVSRFADFYENKYFGGIDKG